METLLNIDESLFKAINIGLSSGFLDSILIPFRHKLFWLPLYLFLSVFIYTNFDKSKWLIYISLGLSIGLSDFTSSKLIKNSIERKRPCHIEHLNAIPRIPCTNGFSFTSSHATNHFAISTFLFMLISFWNYRWLLFLWAGIIGFAQIYVGVHYPSDIIAGSILGCIIGWLSFQFYCWNYNRFYNYKNSENVI